MSLFSLIRPHRGTKGENRTWIVCSGVTVVRFGAYWAWMETDNVTGRANSGTRSGSRTVSRRPRLAITMGDTNGVGPEILAKLLARPELMELCEPVVFGSADVLRKASAVVSVELCLREVPDVPPRGQCADAIPVIDWGYRAPAWNPGVLEAGASRCAVEWLKKAIACAQSGQVDGIVRRITAEIGEVAQVIATGGLAPVVIPESETVTVHRPDLTLQGLRVVFDKNT